MHGGQHGGAGGVVASQRVGRHCSVRRRGVKASWRVASRRVVSQCGSAVDGITTAGNVASGGFAMVDFASGSVVVGGVALAVAKRRRAGSSASIRRT